MFILGLGEILRVPPGSKYLLPNLDQVISIKDTHVVLIENKNGKTH